MTSSQLLRNLVFTVDQLKNEKINILSVFNDKLLVGCVHCPQLFIYSHEGRHLSTITINDNVNYKLRDATWTPRGNIVYTTWAIKRPHTVVAMLESGKVIAAYTQTTSPQLLSVSNDNIIYFADSFEKAVYQSTDDGVSWSLVFKSNEGPHFRQVIKVTTDHSDDFWIMGLSRNSRYCYNHLRVYSVDRKRVNDNVTWMNVYVFTANGHCSDWSYSSTLLYDGKMNIFLSDYDNKAVHVWSVNGQYHCQLLSSHNIDNIPYRLAVDKERQLLYVGQFNRAVRVFKLTYGNEG